MSTRKRISEDAAADAGAVRRKRKRRRAVKFIWGGNKALPGRWVLGLFGFYTQDTGVKTEGLAISIRGVLIWSGLAAVVVYAAGAAVLHRVWQRNPYSRLTYADALFLPLRRGEITRKHGEALLAEGMAALERKQWQVAIPKLQQGLARHPEDRKARLTLAQVYFATQQRDLALRMMAEGLGRDYPGRDYLSAYFGWLEQIENYAEIVALAERYGTGGGRPADKSEVLWLAQRRYLALTAAGRHEEALVALDAADGPELRVVEWRVATLLALKRGEEALARANAARPSARQDAWRVVKLQAEALRQLGRSEEMETLIRELGVLLPGEPGVPVFRIIQLVKLGRAAEARAALADYLFRFGGTPANLAAVANPLAELGELEGLRTCLRAAQERGYPVAQMQAQLVQGLVAGGKWEEARRVLETLPEAATDGNWRILVNAVIDAASSPAEPLQRALIALSGSGQWRPQVLRETVTALLQADRIETAREVLAQAQRVFRHVDWFATRAKEVDLQILARTPAVEAAGPKVRTTIGGEAAFDHELEELVRRREWTSAAQLIQRTYSLRPAPEWLDAAEARIRLTQVRIAQAGRDQPALLTAARLHLNSDPTRGERLLALAAEFFAQGDAAAAASLAELIIKRNANSGAALQALAKWATRAPEAKAVLVQVVGANELRAQQELGDDLRRRSERSDTDGMRRAVRSFLGGPELRRGLVVFLAEEFRQAGEKSTADLLMQELDAARPGSQPAVTPKSGAEAKRPVGK